MKQFKFSIFGQGKLSLGQLIHEAQQKIRVTPLINEGIRFQTIDAPEQILREVGELCSSNGFHARLILPHPEEDQCQIIHYLPAKPGRLNKVHQTRKKKDNDVQELIIMG